MWRVFCCMLCNMCSMLYTIRMKLPRFSFKWFDFQRIRQYVSPRFWKGFIEKYERRLSSIALLGGFVIDTFTLQRVDTLFENIVLFTHISIVGLGILFLNILERKRIRGKFLTRVHLLLLIGIQFSFGAIFSAFVIFYSRSASLAASWPFLLLLLGLLIGNEFVKKQYVRLTFQVGVYFLVIFTFSIFYVPVLIGKIGTVVFLISGLISLVLIVGFLYIISFFAHDRIKKSFYSLVLTVGGIFIAMNSLYFLNIIPPIPLALKDVDVYHDISRANETEYQVLKEVDPWYDFVWIHERLHITPEDRSAYVFSAVFAPTDLNTSIIHNWQYFNKDINRWVTSSKIRFSIVGGRDQGYRGYTKKDNLFPGLWRVNVETSRGQLIGRTRLKIIEDDTLPELEEEII